MGGLATIAVTPWLVISGRIGIVRGVNRLVFKSAIWLAVIFSTTVAPSCAETLTYPDLVHRVTNLDHLATPPSAGERTALASTWSRRRSYDPVTNTYHNWDDNEDGDGIIRMEGDESVFAEIKGPGCIWRTWSAEPHQGHVKIYLDGATTPTIDLPFLSYFDGWTAPFTRSNLVYKTPSNGWNNYTPISFQKSCKIVADKCWGSFYHYNYSQFPPGTVVPTFKLPLSSIDLAALDEANRIIGNPGIDPVGPRRGEKTQRTDLSIPAQSKAVVADLDRSGAVTAIKVRFPLPSDPEERKNLLRQLAIRITWDDDKEPSVWAPLGDFFADAVIPVKYRNLVTGITDDNQWYTYWYMPYSSHARIEVENDSDKSIAMSWEISHVTLAKSRADSLLRFHAKWHRDAFVPQREDRKPDWTILTTQGTGRFVGTQLHLWNPRGGWWGEGDEKFFVDGEKFPSTLGTGSEDYFGFAWSAGSPFSEPLHGAPVNEGNNGHASLYRWHIADNIPFQTGFDGFIEKYFPNSLPCLYDAVAYWYLAPGGKDPYPEIPVSDRIGYWAPLSPLEPLANVIVTVADANNAPLPNGPEIVEGEAMHPTVGDAVAATMDMFGKNWSGNAQLFWQAQRADSHGENEFQAKAGKYEIFARFSQANNYGIVQLSINGTKVGPRFDLFGENVRAAELVDVSAVSLKDGTNILGMDIVGRNTKSGGYCVGLDYLKLVSIP